MDAPKCRTCGERHWSRLCVTPTVTSPVTQPVTKPCPFCGKDHVFNGLCPGETPATPKTKTIAVACAQCQLYEAEIKRLKLALQIGEPVPAKERMRRMRARREPVHD
jgi:hypothetical protein